MSKPILAQSFLKEKLNDVVRRNLLYNDDFPENSMVIHPIYDKLLQAIVVPKVAIITENLEWTFDG